jgi:hypothetical protein
MSMYLMTFFSLYYELMLSLFKYTNNELGVQITIEAFCKFKLMLKQIMSLFNQLQFFVYIIMLFSIYKFTGLQYISLGMLIYLFLVISLFLVKKKKRI